MKTHHHPHSNLLLTITLSLLLPYFVDGQNPTHVTSYVKTKTDSNYKIEYEVFYDIEQRDSLYISHNYNISGDKMDSDTTFYLYKDSLLVATFNPLRKRKVLSFTKYKYDKNGKLKRKTWKWYDHLYTNYEYNHSSPCMPPASNKKGWKTIGNDRFSYDTVFTEDGLKYCETTIKSRAAKAVMLYDNSGNMHSSCLYINGSVYSRNETVLATDTLVVQQRIIQCEYDRKGKLASFDTAGARLDYFYYDADGRLYKEECRLYANHYIDMLKSYSYDESGRLIYEKTELQGEFYREKKYAYH